jgi:hypothetical protein
MQVPIERSFNDLPVVDVGEPVGHAVGPEKEWSET